MSKERRAKTTASSTTKKSSTADNVKAILQELFEVNSIPEFKKKFQHDSYCKEQLFNLKKARKLTRHLLPQNVQDIVDVDQLQVDVESYIDDDLKKLFADVVYRIPYKNSNESIVVYILIELKTQNDKWTIFQLVKYVVRIWDRELKLAENEKRLASFLFPTVIPVIFHHGDKKFTSPTELMKLVRVIKGLEQFTLNMNALLFDV
ncbi:MAG: Rpn family recombination-promoting nuclease/putative transposase, partial [Planctomycetaceae bacterium]|nr:Rpn family recombination-promoting nuclease/putative transposase [Planctomycetaceae bacterium]